MPQINMPQRAPSAWAALAQALEVGSSAYGIKANIDKLQMMKDEETRNIAKAQREEKESALRQDIAKNQLESSNIDLKDKTNLSQGILDKAKLLAASKDYNLSTAPVKGAIEYRTEDGSPIYLTAKNDLSQLIQGIDLKNKLVDNKNKTLEGQLKGIELANKQKEQTQGKPLTATEMDKHNEGAAIPSVLSSLGNTIENNKDIIGPLKGTFGSIDKYDTRAQTIQSQMKATAQMVGKYLEGGVLRKEDEAKYEKMLPQLTDTPDVAKNKLSIVSNILMNRYNQNISNLEKQGFNTSGLPKFEVPNLPKELKGKTSIIQNSVASDNNNGVPKADWSGPFKEWSVQKTTGGRR